MKALFLFLTLCSVLQAAELHPLRIRETAQIDGRLDEPFWRSALIVADFRQRLPIEGARPTEKTEVLLAYNSNALYVGVRASDSQSHRIAATVMKRDNFEIVNNDQFVIAIDSYNDGRNGFWFSTNPLGVRVDAQFFDEGDIFESNWNGVWECQARIGPNGWTAEIAIPFSTLRFKPAPFNVMGINFFRRIIRTNEQIFAPAVPLTYSNGTPNVSIARKYRFEGIGGGKDMQIKPFVKANSQSLGKRAFDGGLDLRFHVTDSLASMLSLNMDFADAEVDDRQLNLTRFALFFPEKRDFFLENSGLFSFGLAQESEIFFSRRIGLANDQTVPILTAGKLTGKIGKTDFGMLDAQTQASASTNAENFGVLRFKTGVSDRSYVGGVFTNTFSASNNNNRTFGVDWNLYFLRDVSLTGFAARSGSSENAYSFAILKQGERTSFRFGYTDVDADFNPAIGFVRRPGTRRWDASFNQPFYLQDEKVRRIMPGFEFVRYQNNDGFVENSMQRWKMQTDLQSDDSITVFADRLTEFLPTNFPIFGDVVVPAGVYTFYDAGFSATTKPGRPIAAEANFTAGQLYDGTHIQTGGMIQWKTSKFLTLTQFVESDHASLREGDFRAQLFRSRFDLSFNTHLSAAGLIQYDNASGEVGANLRFGYLFHEGSQLFVVYNHAENSDAVLLKFTYLFGF